MKHKCKKSSSWKILASTLQEKKKKKPIEQLFLELIGGSFEMSLDLNLDVDVDGIEVGVDVDIMASGEIGEVVIIHADLHLSQETMEMNQTQKAISHTFESTARLAAFLPTASVLVFQLLSPLLSTLGTATTAGLVALCGVVSALSSFTDTVIDRKGNVCHGIATFGGFRILDGTPEKGLAPEVKAKYKVKFVDFVHALMSTSVFAAVALCDENVAKWFYPETAERDSILFKALPLGTGVICSGLFLLFPSKRHPIGFPLPHRRRRN